MTRSILLGILLMAFSSCFLNTGKRVKGDGNSTTSTRQPGNFNRVEQKGSFDVLLKSGPSQEVLIEAEENIAAHIETAVDGNSLVIKTKKGFNLKPTKPIRITVTAPTYAGIESYGSGDIESVGILTGAEIMEITTKGSGNIKVQVKTTEVKAESMGSGNIELAGQSGRTTLASTGSGDLRAEQLVAEAVIVEIRGSGNASVNASKSLEVDVKGSGDVSYRGNPSIKTDIKGSGNIRKID